ncbi:hypothetical protein [Mesorhizobium sp. Root695]|nr:hypothetical protein [Mesorhizobium sp. Root695]
MTSCPASVICSSATISPCIGGDGAIEIIRVLHGRRNIEADDLGP